MSDIDRKTLFQEVAAELAALDGQESRLLDLAQKSARTEQLAQRLAAIESRRAELRRAAGPGGARAGRLTLAVVEAELVGLLAGVHDARQLRPHLTRIVMRPNGMIRVELPDFPPASI